MRSIRPAVDSSPTVSAEAKRYLSLRAIARAVRVLGRDCYWDAARFRLRTPERAPAVRSLMFVCKGNICRSPFAELAAVRWFERAGVRGVRCSSSGLAAVPGTPAPKEAIEAARLFGVLLEDHRSKSYTVTAAHECDALVVFEPKHYLRLRRDPPLRSRVFLLPLLLPKGSTGRGYGRVAIQDPYGKPTAEFRHTYEKIDMGLRALLSLLYARGAQASDTAGWAGETNRCPDDCSHPDA